MLIRRLFACYPNTRMSDVDVTLTEYVRLTLVVPFRELGQVLERIKGSEEEFVPSPGRILRWVARCRVAMKPPRYNGRADPIQLLAERERRELEGLMDRMETRALQLVKRDRERRTG